MKICENIFVNALLTFKVHNSAAEPRPRTGAGTMQNRKNQQKNYVFYRKTVYNDEDMCYNEIAEGKYSFCNNSGKAAPNRERSRGGEQGGSPEPDVFAIGKKNESFDFRKTDDRTREP